MTQKSPLTARRATPADCRLIHDLAWRIFPETYKNILSREQTAYMMEWMYSLDSLRRQMEIDNHVYLLAYIGDKCVGYVSVRPDGEHLFHLEKIYVLPDIQGSGCGKFLFEQAVKLIRDVHPGPCVMELNVNRHNRALDFYRHMGMTIVREGDFPIGNGYYMNDYIMALRIED